MARRSTPGPVMLTVTVSKRTGRVTFSEGSVVRRGKGGRITVLGRARVPIIEVSCACYFSSPASAAPPGNCALRILGRTIWCALTESNPCQGTCELQYRPRGRDTLIIWLYA